VRWVHGRVRPDPDPLIDGAQVRDIAYAEDPADLAGDGLRKARVRAIGGDVVADILAAAEKERSRFAAWQVPTRS
jgi:hypothetical protein